MKYLNELLKLDLPTEDYAIFGSGPLAIRGLVENNDIDIIVRPALWSELVGQGLPVVNGKEIVIGNVSIFKHLLPYFSNLDEFIDAADIFDGVRFVNLEKVKQWKEALGRDKDLSHIEIIDKHISESK